MSEKPKKQFSIIDRKIGSRQIGHRQNGPLVIFCGKLGPGKSGPWCGPWQIGPLQNLAPKVKYTKKDSAYNCWQNITRRIYPIQTYKSGNMLKLNFARDCFLTGQEQACTRITQLFGCHQFAYSTEK